jgi:hypothetical protein
MVVGSFEAVVLVVVLFENETDFPIGEVIATIVFSAPMRG